MFVYVSAVSLKQWLKTKLIGPFSRIDDNYSLKNYKETNFSENFMMWHTVFGSRKSSLMAAYLVQCRVCSILNDK